MDKTGFWEVSTAYPGSHGMLSPASKEAIIVNPKDVLDWFLCATNANSNKNIMTDLSTPTGLKSNSILRVTSVDTEKRYDSCYRYFRVFVSRIYYKRLYYGS